MLSIHILYYSIFFHTAFTYYSIFFHTASTYYSIFFHTASTYNSIFLLTASTYYSIFLLTASTYYSIFFHISSTYYSIFFLTTSAHFTPYQYQASFYHESNYFMFFESLTIHVTAVGASLKCSQCTIVHTHQASHPHNTKSYSDPYTTVSYYIQVQYHTLYPHTIQSVFAYSMYTVHCTVSCFSSQQYSIVL